MSHKRIISISLGEEDLLGMAEKQGYYSICRVALCFLSNGMSIYYVPSELQL